MRKKAYDKYSFYYNFCLKLNWPLLTKHIFSRIYDSDFFEEGNSIKESSAAKTVQIINKYIKFESVFDVGCGMGIYLNEFARIGKDVLGCEFSADALALSQKKYTIFQADATKPITLNRNYDLLICFEVAEHICKRFSKQLVSNCVNNGERILFTAAPVGQGGVGHINEQPYQFWINLFEAAGFSLNTDLSEQMKTDMKSENVVSWIANNLMFFEKSNYVISDRYL
jgi:2-polyprenyl-3-methyl-5-hydroxy-6-metoxy-1,4-benzoquinol methylase